MRQNRKKTIKLFALALVLLLGIGFAALAANLKINGTLNVSRTSWDVHFENVNITEGSVTANPAPTSNNTDTTEMTYTINFTKPGDFFEFTTDIVNDGTIDAMVDVVSNNAYANAASTTPIALPTYLTSTVTYENDISIQPNQLLAHGTSEKIKVRVEFKKDIEVSDLPSSGDTTIVFKFKGDYKQADENSKSIKSIYELGELVYFDPVTNNDCNESTFDLNGIIAGTSTCYKWRVITVGDTKNKNKVTLQMDHNLIESEKWGSISTVVSGPDTLLQSLATQTQTWTKVSLLNYIYESKVQSHNTGYGTLTCENGNCKISTTNNTIATNVRARVITNEELKDMVKEVSGVYPTYDNYYPISKADESIGTTLSWLLENTKNWSNSGATDNVYGNPTEQYWTLSTLTDYNSLMFSYYGDLKYYFPSNLFGIRPVIEIEKSKLS